MSYYHQLRYFRVLAFAVVVLSLLAAVGCDRRATSNSVREDSFAKVKRTGILRVGYIVAPP